MNIISKKDADKLRIDSLFHPINGHTLSVHMYDNGKYSIPCKKYIGREITAIHERIIAVYPQIKTDQDGPYIQFYCLVSE